MEIDTETTLIPFDIETTGYAGAEDDFVTTAILKHNGQYHIWVNTDGDSDIHVPEMYDTVRSESGLENIVLYVCDSEATLLKNLGEYLDSCTEFSDVLTSFKGETRKGTKDMTIPFLRSRCFANALPWILDGFWYTDSYSVLSGKGRIDTNVKAEPRLEEMKKTDLKQFVEDVGFDIQPDRMVKDDLIRAIRENENSTPQMLASWARENNVYFNLPHPDNFRKKDLEGFCEDYSVLQAVDAESFSKIRKSQLQEVIADEFQEEFEMWAVENFQIYPDDPSDLKVAQMKQYIDDKSLDISYNSMSKSELVSNIRASEYTEDMLIEWHKEKGRDIGNESQSDLDGIHRVLVEDTHGKLPVSVDPFTPFSPYDSSGEMVTGYRDSEYANVVLHCLEDVVQIANLTNVMREYVSIDDFNSKIL